MIYLDTNILLYATLSVVDTQKQQDKAIEVITELIDNEILLLSNLNILEYVFVMKKAKEDNEKIENALNVFQSFVKDEKINFKHSLMKLLNNNYAFKNSFDLYHVSFANDYNCQKLLTFDKGFKKFKNICDVDIDILG